jgi:bacillithiol synthase
MQCKATHLTYRQTGYFPKIIVDYLEGAESLRPFFKHQVSLSGIESAIRTRQQFPGHRKTLVATLNEQYSSVETGEAVRNNIDKLLGDNCFTVTTAHQPAIFTGTLYFLYKILHTIKLAGFLAESLPQYRFVPVFYMGSEDADLDELGHIYLDQEKLDWDTKQTGAVGRMNPKGLDKILLRIEGEFSVLPFGMELVKLLKDCYLTGPDIQTATFKFVHALMGQYGIVILIPDNANLKRAMLPVFEDDLFHQTPSVLVEETIRDLSIHFKVQAHHREINLFYLKDNLRGRIEKKGAVFFVADPRSPGSPGLTFTEKQMRDELNQYPERFSPNVILRGLFQETILPNIAFIGGGGELAYWLELKKLFEQYKVPYPLLVLRNSFLIIVKKWREKMKKMDLSVTDIWKPEEDLLNELVKKQSGNQVNLDKELKQAEDYYEKIRTSANQIDPPLSQHVEALKAKALKALKELEKKLLKAEKRKYEDQRRQIHEIRSALFPLGELQERIENLIPNYAAWGKQFIEVLFENSFALEQKFVVLLED